MGSEMCIRDRHDDTIDRYLNYNAHVSRTIYEEVGEALEGRRALKEQEWPEYKEATAMISCPRYLRSNIVGKHDANMQSGAVAEGQQWLKEYLADVQCLQEYKQHHVHPVNLKTCLLYTSPSPRDGLLSRMPSSA